jgi:hypothetical protein
MILDLYITDKKIEATNIQQDLVFRAKNTNILDLYFYDENDLSIDITGAKIYFTVKNKPSDTDNDAVLKKDITVLTDPNNGNAQVEITPTDSSSLLGNYLYSIKIKMSDNKIYTGAEGTICFRKEITERTS